MPPKKMPEKKKGQEDEPVGFNVNIMSLAQLKQYTRLLEDDIENMRKYCNFHQKTEDELAELLRLAEEDLKYDEDILVLKDVELEKLKLNFLKHLHEKRQLPKYLEHTSSEKKEKLSSEISDRLKEEQNRHILEVENLKSILQEKNKQLEALKVKIEMDRREAMEKNEEHLKDMDSSQKTTLKQVTERYDRAKKETQDEFRQALEIINLEAREGKIRGERNLNESCLAFKQKLHNYYKEITKQDLDTIKKFKNKIVKIENNIKNSKILLEKAKEENKEWKEKLKFETGKLNPSDIVVKFDAGPLRMIKALKIHNKTEKLALKNQNLEKQIKDITEQINILKRQFTIALGKVRDSAEIKVAFLDKKLNFILDENGSKNFVSPSVSDVAETSDQSRSEAETTYSDKSVNP